ncbi:MAG: DNA-binding protein WhiA [Christensenellaceae bacterium]|jgi:DNA-binding protein WhiA|nr:DNA-binding protein WhiA [Christensenellaceae bacterium]
MSIATIIKNEILDDRLKGNCCKKAFLSAVMRGAGNLKLTKHGLGIIIQHSNQLLVEKCAGFIISLTGSSPDITQKTKHQGLGDRCVFELSLDENSSENLLSDIGITCGTLSLTDYLPLDLLKTDCCKKAYLQGLFVSAGSLTIADDNGTSKSSGYLLEIILVDDAISNAILSLMNDLGLHLKHRTKRRHSIIYSKSSQIISDFFAFIGAGSGYFALQDVIISRNCKNNITRKVNWEMANLDRSMAASQKQLKAIMLIDSKIGIRNLDAALRDVAFARIENPSATATELLSRIKNQPTMSALHHRMRKLIEMADEFNN